MCGAVNSSAQQLAFEWPNASSILAFGNVLAEWDRDILDDSLKFTFCFCVGFPRTLSQLQNESFLIQMNTWSFSLIKHSMLAPCALAQFALTLCALTAIALDHVSTCVCVSACLCVLFFMCGAVAASTCQGD